MSKKWIFSLCACVLFLTMSSHGAIWGGAGATDNWSNSTNWLNGNIADGAGEIAEFRVAGTNVVLTQERTVFHLFQQNTAVSRYFSGSALTVHGNLSNFSVNTTDMVFSNQVTMFSSGGRRVQTDSLGSMELAGGLAITNGAVEFGPDGGNITISGNLDAGGVELRLANTTTGTVLLTGAGTWSGGGILRVYGGTLISARTSTNSTGIAADLIQIWDGGTLRLGNDEQIVNSENIGFPENGGLFDLDGYTETIKGFATLASVTGNIAMGTAGTLHIINQSTNDVLDGLLITEWTSGEDHIYVDGGSFGSNQLLNIIFDGFPAGAVVSGGELFPATAGYSAWAAGFGVGDETADDDNDGLLNLYEYGLGGDPTNSADQGISPTFIQDAGGTNLVYIYPQLSDPNSGLDYLLELTDNLTIPSWTNAGYTVVGTNIVAGDFDYVTNSISTETDPEQFIRLIIEAL